METLLERLTRNKYYKNKNDERWVVYKDNIEASKITSRMVSLDSSYSK